MKKSNSKANIYAVLASLLFAAPLLLLTAFSADFKEIMFDPNSVTGKFRQMGFGLESVMILLVIALLKTSFAEELFFRGFLTKRLIAWLGFKAGNIIQAVIFGVLHTAIFAFITQNLFFLMVILVVPAIGAWVSGYLNEKMANGSIIPGWISHGLANILAYGIVGFII